MNSHHHPPHWAARVLGWLLRDDWETPMGDYEEFYSEIANEQGVWAARRWYFGQLLRLIPDQLSDRVLWGAVLFRNYWLLAFRNLRKDRLASSINIVGLSAAVGIVITIFLLIQQALPNDNFHENGERIFLVGHELEHEGDEYLFGTSPVPLGPALAADLPQVEQAVRLSTAGATVRADGSAFQEGISFADAAFLGVLTFPLERGQPSALEDPSAIIISAEMADKYFRDQNPMDQILEVKIGAGETEALIVKGVAEPFPARAALEFDFLVGYHKRPNTAATDLEEWAHFTDGTFLQLRDASDARFVEDHLNQYVPLQNEANESWQVQAYFLDNIQSPDLTSVWMIDDRAVRAPPVMETIGFGLVGLLVLLISCFNYITISLGSAARRLKEIGVRKTAGAEKRQLVFQFLTENLALCTPALLGGLAFAALVVLPFFHRLTSAQLAIDLTANLGLWVFLVGLLAFVALVSGAYPAFYVSSFQPIAILRDKLKLGEKKGLTRTLATVQFVLTLMTICVSVFILSLEGALKGGDWGYQPDQTLVIPTRTHDQHVQLRVEAERLTGVRRVAGARHHIGTTYDQMTVRVDGEDELPGVFHVGPSYLDVMGLRVESGRLFGEAYSADSSASIVINQTFAREHGWTEPLGKEVRIDDQSLSVVGVVEDFLLYPILGKERPVLFRPVDPAQHQVLILSVDDGAADRVAASMEAIWDERFPEVPFVYHPQTEVFEEYDFLVELSLKFSGYLGIFALLVSCMGLFGMASHRAARAMKEMGIRKVMGASPIQLVFLANRGFLVMLGIATLIATPICFAALKLMLSFAPMDIPLGAAPFVVSNVLVGLLAAASLSMQTNRLIRVNPADVLRYE